MPCRVPEAAPSAGLAFSTPPMLLAHVSCLSVALGAGLLCTPRLSDRSSNTHPQVFSPFLVLLAQMQMQDRFHEALREEFVVDPLIEDAAGSATRTAAESPSLKK